MSSSSRKEITAGMDELLRNGVAILHANVASNEESEERNVQHTSHGGRIVSK